MTDLDRLRRAILIDPSDDVARLALADELEAVGEQAEANWIRSSLMFPTTGLFTGIPEWRCGTWGGEYYCVSHRGFVDEWHCTLGDYVRCAARVFAAHPITSVWLDGKIPVCSSVTRMWTWDASKKADSVPNGLPWYFFPVGLQSVAFSAYADAHDWLSRTAVDHGRKLAGLPPLPSPVPSD